MLRIAVIIVSFEAGDMLRRCLEALDRQSTRPNRVIVVDNGSRDGSVDRCRPHFPSVEFHQSHGNVGFAAANNFAVAQASDCDWVAFLNPDAFPAPQWLEAFLSGIGRYPDVDTFASFMVSAVDPSVIDGIGDSYRVDGVAWPRLQGGSVRQVSETADEVFSACAGAALYRRSTFLRIGGFNERFFCYYEDVDLGFRLQLMGRKCMFLPQAVVYHVGSASTGGGSDFSIYHVHRNMVWTYVLNMPAPYIWRYLPAHLATNLMTIALFVLKGRGRIILRSKWHAVRALPAILAQRRVVQRARRIPPYAALRLMNRGHVLGSLWRRLILRVRSWRQGPLVHQA